VKSSFGIIIGLATALIARAQIQQTSPELCGRPHGTVVSIPAGVAASVDHSIDRGTISVAGLNKTIDIPGVVSYITQVCPLPDSRLVVFGNSYQSTNVSILDVRTGVLLDNFYATDPVMSPNQQWIVYETFYPAHTDERVSDEYRLYDLTKNATKNRVEGSNPEDSISVGSVIFPLVQNGVQAEQRHEARSHSFAWAPDSKAFAFTDEVSGRISVVLVTLNSQGDTVPYVFPLSLESVCSTGQVEHEGFVWDTLKLEVSNSPHPSVNVNVTARRDCYAKPLTVFSRTSKRQKEKAGNRQRGRRYEGSSMSG
jgi:hypothetical protein